MAKLSIRDLDVAGKEVLMRVDFNVPLDGTHITDTTRIEAALPSIRHLLDQKARLVLCSHLGRPKGEVNPQYSLKPVAEKLTELLGTKVAFVSTCIGPEVDETRKALAPGEILLLENTRFQPGEKANDPTFAQALAGTAQIYINDAFGTAHRAHASTAGVTQHIAQSAMGLLMERELQYLSDKLQNPKRPFLVIMGGKKVSDKIGVITALLEKADAFLIGGAMAYTFRKAQGYEIGNSYVVDSDLELAREILAQAQTKGVNFLLPADSLEADDFSNNAQTRVTEPYSSGGGITPGWEGIDIGTQAIQEFCAAIAQAQTIVWNGPMGVFEIDAFAQGTKAIAEALAASPALTIVGGGDSVTAANKFGIADQLTFISTGGGASLELLEGQELPGITALSDQA